MIRVMFLAVSFVVFSAAALAGDVDCSKAMTQMDMDFCAGKNFQASDKKLNDTYRDVMTALGDKNYQAKLKAAQRAWIAYRDTECTFEVAENEGGSIYPMVYSLCETKLTDARTKELQSYLACFKDAEKCQ